MEKDILSCRDLSRGDIQYILEKSQEMEKLVAKKGKLNLLCGKIAATLFFEPSTRTRLSFETAMQRMGGDIIGFSSVEGTSVKKGETLDDTIKTVDQYADVIIIRHPQIGVAKIAADVADAPVINAGDGAGEHPTQALLDLYTIHKAKNTIDGLTIALVGDLKHARVMHSLAYALSNFDVKLYLISPAMLKMPVEILDHLKNKQINFTEMETLDPEVVTELDVLYTIRIQKERFPSEEEYIQVKESYRITPELLMHAKEDMIILHPLPRREELPPEIDKTPFAKYFEQARNGVYVRMALLGIVLDVL